MATFRRTTYTELIGNNSPERSFSVDGGKVTRELKIDGDKTAWRNAVEDFLGYGTVAVAGGARYITRTTPHAFPPTPWLYAQNVPRLEGLAYRGNHPDDVAEYLIDKLTLTYSSLTYDVREDADVLCTDALSLFNGLPDEGWKLAMNGHLATRNITRTVKPGAKLLVLNHGSMKFVRADCAPTDLGILMEGIPYVEPVAEVQYVWHNVPADGVPNARYLVSHGCINDEEFDKFPAGTLRLDSAEPQPMRRDPAGNRICDVVIKAQFLPRYGHKHGETAVNDYARGHNWFIRLGMLLARVTADGTATGMPPFRSIDFTSLFRPDQP